MMKALAFALLVSTFVFLSALSGYGDSPDFGLDTIAPELTIISPNGGEIWYIGDTCDIEWIVTDTNLGAEAIDLSYSLNSGSDFTSLATQIPNSGTYAWELPAVQSNAVLVLIDAMDSFGNLASKSSFSTFSISYVPPASPTGLIVDLSGGEDAILSWDAVSHTIPPYNTPITPDGYIVLYNETPYEEDQYYYFLAETDQLTHTHHRVVNFRDQMFYRIAAYKNYSREQAEILQSLVQRSHSERISWPQARAILMGAAQ